MSEVKYIGVIIEKEYYSQSIVKSVVSKFTKNSDMIVITKESALRFADIFNNVMSPDAFSEFAKEFISYCIVFASSYKIFELLVNRYLGDSKDSIMIIAVIGT